MRLDLLCSAAALALGAAAAAPAGPPTLLYTLSSDSAVAQGCFDDPDSQLDCLCPVTFADDFFGSFGLTVLPSGNPALDVWSLDAIDLTLNGPDGEVHVTGSGLYARQPGSEEHRLELELSFNGSDPVPLDSGFVPNDAAGTSPPVIDIQVSDGQFCPGRRLTISAAPGAATASDVAPMGGDGAVGIGDLLAVLADWGRPGPRITDVDASGEVGVGDMLAVLAEWTG